MHHTLPANAHFDKPMHAVLSRFATAFYLGEVQQPTLHALLKLAMVRSLQQVLTDSFALPIACKSKSAAFKKLIA